MDPDLEKLTDKSIHPVIDHKDRAVGRIEHGEIQNRTKEVMLFAENFRPVFELPCPLLLILFESIFTFEDKFELIVAVIFITKHTHGVDIEFMQVAEVGVVVFLDPDRHGIHHAKGIGAHEVLDLDEIDEVLQEL